MKGVKVWFVTALIMMLTGMGLAVAGTAMGGKWNMRFDYKNFKVVTGSENYISDKINIDHDIRFVDIETGTVDVIVKKGEKCSLEYYVPDDMKPDFEIDGQTLKLTTKDEGWFFFFGWWGREVEPYIILTLPESEYDYGARLNVDMESSTGDITIENLSITGNVKTSTGDITLNNTYTGNIDLSVSTGDITLEKCDVNGYLKTTSSTGEVYIMNTNIQEKYEAETSTGDIEITDFSTLSSFKVSGSTSDITVKSSTVKNISIETSTGDVELKLKGDKESYTVKTETSTGDLKIFGQEKDVDEYESGNGNNSIYVSTSTGDIEIDFE